ncbi:hypothetical protein GGR51DRAFT_578408 [Nemania sp. FL0031]|nr:hypothetical protein GGR51DRAFT_578408 [Nemania sp. FL0031]
MPAYTTTQQFTCGHTHTTPNSPSSTPPSSVTIDLPDSDLPITEPVPMSIRCLYCVCDSILTVSTSSPSIIPRSDLRELEQHIEMLKPVVNPAMRRDLEFLEKKMLRLDDVDDIWCDLLRLMACAADM